MYKIYAGLAGATFICELASREDAEKAAYEAACEEYESYAGLHASVEDIIEDEGCDEETAVEIWLEEREGWLDYYVQ